LVLVNFDYLRECISLGCRLLLRVNNMILSHLLLSLDEKLAYKLRNVTWWHTLRGLPFSSCGPYIGKRSQVLLANFAGYHFFETRLLTHSLALFIIYDALPL
jgi:hypothetical protein